jgi:hypothetical protein
MPLRILLAFKNDSDIVVLEHICRRYPTPLPSMASTITEAHVDALVDLYNITKAGEHANIDPKNYDIAISRGENGWIPTSTVATNSGYSQEAQPSQTDAGLGPIPQLLVQLPNTPG